MIPEIWFETPERVGELTPFSKATKKETPKQPTYLVSGKSWLHSHSNC
jgi:hypothetical protein